MKQKKYAVLGLGIFGSTIAKTLVDHHCDVIAIDYDSECIDRARKFLASTFNADFTDIDQLRDLGIQSVDVAIVAISHLESSILTILHLKELGVSYVVAKAKNKLNQRILLKMGADKVLCPDEVSGLVVADTLLHDLD